MESVLNAFEKMEDIWLLGNASIVLVILYFWGQLVVAQKVEFSRLTTFAGLVEFMKLHIITPVLVFIHIFGTA